MALSFATSRVGEAIRIESLLPSELRSSSGTLTGLIEEYYRYMSLSGSPTRETLNITEARDIDLGSQGYLDAIGNEIAKTIPGSSYIDKVSLYKKLVSFYSTRGSTVSIELFFKIFFNEIVEVSFPKEDILRPSSGLWNGVKFLGSQGFLSSDKVLQDGEFFQEFSYLIKSSLPLQDWELNFAKLVHPAGLRFFAEISLLLLVLTRVSSWQDTRTGGFSWEDLRIINSHSPIFQPGWIDAAERTLRFILSANSITEDMARIVSIVLGMIVSSGSWYLQSLHSSYDWLKEFDSTPVEEYSEMLPLSPDGSFSSFKPAGNWNQLGTIINLT